RSLQQLYFGTLNQVADIVDVLRLQAVGRTYSQFQIVNRAQQDRIDLVFLLDNHWLAITFQINERSQLLLQDGRGTTDSLFRIQGTVGFQIDDQLVQVSTLLDTGVFHHVGDTAYRAERSIQLQTTDAAA